MDLNDIISDVADQDRGKLFELINPVSGLPTGISMTIAGPDSQTQRRARLTMQDRLIEAGPSIDAATREGFALQMLASCILSWTVEQGGQPHPLSNRNAVSLLAVSWVREQIDGFAADRSQYLQGVK